jgi:hypothetical protein
MAAKLTQMPMWQGKYPVLDTTDISGARPHEDDLEMRAAINEHHHKLPRHEAEAKAYADYRREQVVTAAAHHYVGIKASAAAGNKEAARKHGLMYLFALKQLGHNDPVRPPEEVMEKIKNTPSDEIGRFKAHKGDVFTVPPEPEEETPRGPNEQQVKSKAKK